MQAPKIPYSKHMIDLIHFIRRRMPVELRSGVRFSNPDIFLNISHFYYQTQDSTVKEYIKELLAAAGTNLINQMEPNKLDLNKEKGSSDLPTSKNRGQVFSGKATRPITSNNIVEKRNYPNLPIANV